MNRSDIAVNWFKQGFNCSQSVLAAFAESLGLDNTKALKVAAGFGGGLGRTAGTCGAVTGAVIALGLKFGAVSAGDATSKEATYAQVQEFLRRFAERHRSICCRDLLGCDISTAGGLQAARDKNLFATQCPNYVRDAADILEELLR